MTDETATGAEHVETLARIESKQDEILYTLGGGVPMLNMMSD